MAFPVPRMPQATERRLNQIFPIGIPLQHKLFRYGRNSGKGQALDLSSGGALIQSEVALPKGLQVELSIAWPARLDGVVGLTFINSRYNRFAARVPGPCRRRSLNKLYINTAGTLPSGRQADWAWPVNPAKYDRRAELSSDEAAELAYLAGRQRPYGHFPSHTQATLRRLTDPLDDVMAALRPPQQTRSGALTVMLVEMHKRRFASQLFNAKEPMSLFELQRWLGHKWANSTQHYLDISPTKLAQSFRDAGYFSRNVRAVEVLIGREVVVNGNAGREPWKFYELGHGYSTYDFFDQCPHRMACAKCGFYLAKGSSRAQLLEGKANLLQMRQEIPLNDAELAAVDDGLAALQKLLDQLEDVATPAGPTPRQLQAAELVHITGTEPEKSLTS